MAPLSSDASDTELIRHLRAGHQQALSILYDRYGGLVYTLALRILNQPDEAEDLTQEVFLTFWKQDKFDPTRAVLSTYLCLLTRSRAINKLHSRASHQRSIERLQQQVVPEAFSAPTPLERASQNEQQQAVKQAMSQLSDLQRQVLELNYFQGMSQSAIAQHLNLPLGTVKTHARQGLIKLRQLLGEAIG